MSACAAGMIAYIAVIRPQNERIVLKLTAAGEGLMLFLHLISIYFLNDDLPDYKANRVGFLIIAIVGLYILVNWLIVIYITVMDMK